MKKHLLISSLLLSVIFSKAQNNNFQQGLDAYQKNEYNKALEYFSMEIIDKPTSPLPYYYRSLIYNFQGKDSSALNDLNSCIDHFSSKETALLESAHQLKAVIFLKFKNYDKTFEEYASAIKLAPGNVDLLIGRAQIYFTLKQYDKAEADYQQVLKIKPNEVLALAGLGKIYLTLQNYPEAEKTLNKLIESSPKFTVGYQYRGAVYFEQKKYADAIDDLFQCLLLNETDKQIRNSFIEYSAKDFPYSFSKVNAQISAQPDKGVWYFVRALLEESKYDYKPAIEDFDKAIALTDGSVRSNIQSYKAYCFYDEALYKESIDAFSKAISMDSTAACNFEFRGEAKRLAGNYSGAIEDYTKALAMEIESRKAITYCQRGMAKASMKDYEGAIKDYGRSIELNKNYVYTYLSRARLYDLKLKNPAKAREDYLTILSLEFFPQDFSNSRQFALHGVGRTDEAIAWQKAILEQYPTWVNYYDAICFYSMLNKPKEAIECMKILFGKGFTDLNLFSEDADFDNIRNLPEFKALVAEQTIILKGSLKKE